MHCQLSLKLSTFCRLCEPEVQEADLGILRLLLFCLGRNLPSDAGLENDYLYYAYHVIRTDKLPSENLAAAVGQIRKK
jgi:hypothetical protein